MTAHPKLWAAKLTKEQQVTFWSLVTEWGFSGETAYCRVLAGEHVSRRA